MLEHLRRETDDLHEVAVAQLARDRPEDAGAARVVLGVDDHGGVLVEGDVRAVLAPELLLRAHDDGLDDVALLDRALRRGLLDGGGGDAGLAGGALLHRPPRRALLAGGDDAVAHAGVAPARAAHAPDAQQLARAGV